MRALFFTLCPALLALSAAADPATILDIRATPSGDAWRFDVTVEHGDTGWDDYADGWEVRLPDGTVLGTRVLYHPHENEQPFTRSHAIKVPEGVTEVVLFVSENVGGWGTRAYPFTLPAR